MLRLCIVDDDEPLRDTLAMYFEMSDLTECIKAGSLKELETHVKEVPGLNIAILDVNLGEGQPDGLRVYEWLCKNGFQGRTIFISGHARTEPKIEAVCKTPGTCFLEKPFKIEDLRALIE